MAVYLLHSTVAVGGAGPNGARHYLGWCKEGGFSKRYTCHVQNRHSAKLVQAFLRNGGALRLGNYWPGRTREDESKMKRAGHIADKCLICKIEELQRQLMELEA